MNKERLFISEWEFTNIGEEYNSFNNKVKNAEIVYNGFTTTIPLYSNDMKLLKTIFGCSESELVGKKISIVNVTMGDSIIDSVARAIGHEGLYIQLYCWDNSSKILSENELCEILEVYDVVRLNKNEKPFYEYTVPTNKVNKFR